jgi:hypothetical protein
MLTLERFKSLADSYGASLERWPGETRQEARALLSNSPAAQAILAQAQLLDDAIATAVGKEDSRTWPPEQATAALGRLRSRVAARLIDQEETRSTAGIRRWLLSRRSLLTLCAQPGWGGMLTGGALAIAAGLVTGLLYASSPPPRNMLLLLEPTPLQIFSDSPR